MPETQKVVAKALVQDAPSAAEKVLAAAAAAAAAVDNAERDGRG
jgi:hypothetical protein